MNKLTADTITDEQIRELRAATVYAEAPFDAFARREARDLLNTCDDAIFGPNVYTTHSDYYGQKREARSRCAEILNARAEGKS